MNQTKMDVVLNFRSHMKTDDANRRADTENLYISGFKGILKNKFSRKKISRRVASISIIDGKLKKLIRSSPYILMGNFT